MASGKFAGQVVLVTGASSGMGKSAAIEFAKEGAKVVLFARSEDKLKSAAEEIKSAGGEAAICVGDVVKEDDCKKAVDTAMDTFGGLHIAFNNAGVFQGSPLVEATEEVTSTVLDTNVKSLVFSFKYQIPAMEKSGGKGSIIVNSSIMAQRPTSFPPIANSAVYAASKAAADMLMRYAAIEAAPKGIRVNCVSPGHVFTPIYGGASREDITNFTKTDQLIGRPIEDYEVSKMVLFLASDDAAMITGSTYNVDGGWGIKA